MPIPKEILAVKRPSSTVVKARGERFVVIKRTSKRKGGRVVPVDLGMVGEIIDGRFVERVIKRKKKAIDIKDYGEVTLCNKMGCDLLQELANVWDIGDAKRLYVMALLRAAFGDVKNGELQLGRLSRGPPLRASRLVVPGGDGAGILAHQRVHANPRGEVRRQEHRDRRDAQGLQLEGELSV